jgi:hypothetical protein
MSKPTSYEADIRPLFTQRDIQGNRHRRGEKAAGLNLASISSANGWRTAFSLRRSGVTAAHA